MIPGRFSTRGHNQQEVKIRGGPMRRGYGTNIDAQNDFVLKSHILAKLPKELKSIMRLKSASTRKEATYGEMERPKEQIQSLLKNLKTYVTYVNPFYGAARNRETGAEVPVTIINVLLSSREKVEG